MVVTRKVRTKKDDAPSTSSAPTEDATEKVLPDVSEVEESEAENIEEQSQAPEEVTAVEVNISDVKNEGGGEEVAAEAVEGEESPDGKRVPKPTFKVKYANQKLAGE